MASNLKALAYTNGHMEKEHAPPCPSGKGGKPRRKPGMVARIAARHQPETVLQKLIEPGDSRRAAFCTMAKMGVRAVPALLAEMEDKVADERGFAAQLLRRIVESRPHTDWDCVLLGQRAGRVKEALAALVEDENPEVALNAMGALRAVMRDPPGEIAVACGLPEKPAGGVLAACWRTLGDIAWLKPWDEG